MYRGCKNPSPFLLCSSPFSSDQSCPITSRPSDPEKPVPASLLRCAVVSRGQYRSPCWHQPNPAGKLMGVRRFASSNRKLTSAIQSGTEILRLTLRSRECPGFTQRQHGTACGWGAGCLGLLPSPLVPRWVISRDLLLLPKQASRGDPTCREVKDLSASLQSF